MEPVLVAALVDALRERLVLDVVWHHDRTCSQAAPLMITRRGLALLQTDRSQVIVTVDCVDDVAVVRVGASRRTLHNPAPASLAHAVEQALVDARRPVTPLARRGVLES